MRIEDLNWFDIENYLQKEDRLILILGACEQHGYLSMLSDVLIPLALADAASKETGVLIAPPINFGVSPYFLDYPGTLSLRVTTLFNVTEDLVRSAYHQGFRRFLFLNGHGGNDPVRARLYELANELPGVRFAWYAWWVAHSVEEVAVRHQLKPYHAAWSEAFPFTRVADLPEGEKIPARIPGLMGAAEAREVYGDGVFGGAYSAPSNVMQELFEAALLDVMQLLKFE
jgi:creatinine amidohydrolase